MQGNPVLALLLAGASAFLESYWADVGPSSFNPARWWKSATAPVSYPSSKNLTFLHGTRQAFDTSEALFLEIALFGDSLRFQEGREWNISSMTFSLGPDSYKIIRLPPRYVALKPWGTRVFPSVRAYEDRVWSDTPTRVYGCMPSVISFSSSLSFWSSALSFALLFAISRLWRPEELWDATKTLANIWLGVLSNMGPIAFVAFRSAFFTIVGMLEWGLWLGEISLVFFSLCLDACISFSQRLQDEQRTKESERLREECIQRKQPTLPVRKPSIRPLPSSSDTPLFSTDASKTLTRKYLPEEIGMAMASPSLHPLRDMYDPFAFTFVKQIGAGAFGCVMQVEHRAAGRAMALKKLRGEDNSEEAFESEVRAMVRLQDAPWYPELYGTFRDVDCFYILMPFYVKGDLYEVVSSYGGCFHRTLAKFYLAELILAIQGLHQRGIIHRDLKPENILFKEDGHLVVADFGVAHVFEDEEDEFLEDEFPLWVQKKARGGDEFPLLTPSVDNPHTTAGAYGTPFYAAPEVLQGLEYSYGVDYFSVAFIYHEMVTGFVPLLIGSIRPGSTEPEVEVSLGRRDIHLQTVSAVELDFLEKMLREDPYARLTLKQMKSHPIFTGMDWDKMARLAEPIPRPPALRKRVALSHSTICSDLDDEFAGP